MYSKSTLPTNNKSPSSIIQSNSNTNPTTSPMDDANFAPPPPPPQVRQYSGTPHHTAMNLANVNLPNYSMMSHSGLILARLSTLSLVQKRWKPIFWISYGSSKLLFFRCKEDYNEWMTNTLISAEERQDLVKMKVDFVNDVGQDGVTGFQPTQMGYKDYASAGNLHSFKLEELINDSPNTIAAFGARKEVNATNLRTIIVEFIKKSRNQVRSVQGQGHVDTNFAYPRE